VLVLVGVNQNQEKIEAIAIDRSGLCAPQPSYLRIRGLIPGLILYWPIDIHELRSPVLACQRYVKAV
jgi:hypothetical protein